MTELPVPPVEFPQIYHPKYMQKPLVIEDKSSFEIAKTLFQQIAREYSDLRSGNIPIWTGQNKYEIPFLSGTNEYRQAARLCKKYGCVYEEMLTKKQSVGGHGANNRYQIPFDSQAQKKQYDHFYHICRFLGKTYPELTEGEKSRSGPTSKPPNWSGEEDVFLEPFLTWQEAIVAYRKQYPTATRVDRGIKHHWYVLTWKRRDSRYKEKLSEEQSRIDKPPSDIKNQLPEERRATDGKLVGMRALGRGGPRSKFVESCPETTIDQNAVQCTVQHTIQHIVKHEVQHKSAPDIKKDVKLSVKKPRAPPRYLPVLDDDVLFSDPKTHRDRMGQVKHFSPSGGVVVMSGNDRFMVAQKDLKKVTE